MADYTIEARSYRLGFASHNFWVLGEESGAVMAELHGLATSRSTGEIVPIGTTCDHGLRVYVFPHDPAYAARLELPVKATRMFSRSRGQAVYRGPDGLARWTTAVAAIPVLNELDLDYPTYGFNVFSRTVNSNSAYRTFGEIMGVPIRAFQGVIGPGLANRMIAAEQIARLRFEPGSATA